jgi:hypothetical protein
VDLVAVHPYYIQRWPRLAAIRTRLETPRALVIAADKLLVQGVVGSLLYCGRGVDATVRQKRRFCGMVRCA